MIQDNSSQSHYFSYIQAKLKPSHQQQIFNRWARKSLSLQCPIDPSHKILKLPKSIIKTILKKKPHKKVSDTLFKERAFLKFGEAFGSQINRMSLRPIPYDSVLAIFFDLDQISMSKLKKYKKIMLSCKSIKEFQADSKVRVPLKFYENIAVMRNLTGLNLNLSHDLFYILPSILKKLNRLKKLILKLYFSIDKRKDVKEDKTLLVFQNFVKRLSELKNLETLALWLDDVNFYESPEDVMELITCIQNMNLLNFQLKIPFSRNHVIEPSKMEKILESLDSLMIVQASPSSYLELDEGKRVLQFLKQPGQGCFNPEALIKKCSSLQSFKIHSSIIGIFFPEDLGLAKNLKRFEIEFPDLSYDESFSQQLSRLYSMLSQIKTLESFSAKIPKIQERSIKKFSDLNEFFSTINLKEYKLKIDTSFNKGISISNEIFQTFLTQLSKIQTLESIILSFTQLEDVETLRILFNNFPHLKSLEIQIENMKEHEPFNFPYEDLNQLKCLEKLKLGLAGFEKKNALLRLLKMESLKEIDINNFSSNWANRITMADYKQI